MNRLFYRRLINNNNTFVKNHRRTYIDFESLRIKYFDVDEPDRSNLTKHTLQSLAKLTSPPTSSITLSRTFIEDSLYNPNYGYFSKQAVIFNPTTPVNITECEDGIEFLNRVAKQYDLVVEDLSEVNDISRQVWHTPTELFNPHYGNALANYIVQDYIKDSGFEPLVIYEMGGGNGTTMNNILDYIKINHPEIYSKTKYCIIDISEQLNLRQKNSLKLKDGRLKHTNVQFINKSIFEFDNKIEENCYFLALEVIDNFAHDVLRLDRNNEPFQGLVVCDKDNNFEEVYQPLHDPTLTEYYQFLNNNNLLNHIFSSNKLDNLFKEVTKNLPFQTNFQTKVYLPTRAYQFLKKLDTQFPNHKLILTDFYKLPQTVNDGKFAPVVQTRYQKVMVPCSTYLVQQGYFDIFFPTDFELLKKTYRCLGREGKVFENREFLKQYGDIKNTTTKSGENLLLDYYSNNKFFIS